ncbi:MAG: hypothetical protein ABR529_00665, partial [Actinomycetota bacterium]
RLEHDLKRRYGADYDIVATTSWVAGLRRLKELHRKAARVNDSGFHPWSRLAASTARAPCFNADGLGAGHGRVEARGEHRGGKIAHACRHRDYDWDDIERNVGAIEDVARVENQYPSSSGRPHLSLAERSRSGVAQRKPPCYPVVSVVMLVTAAAVLLVPSLLFLLLFSLIFIVVVQRTTHALPSGAARTDPPPDAMLDRRAARVRPLYSQ